jgi:VWFA-related protein
MDRQKMRRKLQCVSLAMMIFITPPLFSGPFIRINSIDSSSAFPGIDVTVTVQNMDRSFISGLDEANLLVYEDGYRVNYVKVSTLDGSAEKVHLVFCVDSSRSISEAFLKNIKSSARDLIQSTGQRDQIAIYRFNDRVQLLKNFTANRSEMESAIEGIVRHGKETLLYNSIYDAIQILEDAGAVNRAIIVFSDGKDEGSSLTVQDIIGFAREKSVPVYFISFMPSRKNVTLERISKLTGGRMIYSKDQADIIGIYRSILSAVKSRYLIRYQSILQPDDKAHQLEIRLSHESLRDRETAEFRLKNGFSLVGTVGRDRRLLQGILFVILLVLLIFFITILRKKLQGLPLPRLKLKPSGSYKTENPKKTGKLSQAYYRESCDEDSDSESAEAGEKEYISAEAPASAYSDAWLVVREGAEAGKKVPLRLSETIMGRDPDCDLVLADSSASPKHAKIKSLNNNFYIFDLVSEGGTFLNGQKLLRPKILYDWDEIGLGDSRFIFRGSRII